jgi:hypothetical protein
MPSARATATERSFVMNGEVRDRRDCQVRILRGARGTASAWILGEAFGAERILSTAARRAYVLGT